MLQQKTKKKFKDEEEEREVGRPSKLLQYDHIAKDELAQELNQDSLFQHYPTIPSLMKPMYEPVREEILNPQNVLAAGSKITLG